MANKYCAECDSICKTDADDSSDCCGSTTYRLREDLEYE